MRTTTTMSLRSVKGPGVAVRVCVFIFLFGKITFEHRLFGPNCSSKFIRNNVVKIVFKNILYFKIY